MELRGFLGLLGHMKFMVLGLGGLKGCPCQCTSSWESLSLMECSYVYGCMDVYTRIHT